MTSVHPSMYYQQQQSPNFYQSPASQPNLQYTSGYYSSTSASSSPTQYNHPQAAQTADATRYHCLHYCCAVDQRDFKRKADLERHVDSLHNRDQQQHIDCLVPECHRKGQFGFVRKDKMIEHVRDVHKLDIPKRSPGKKSPQ